MNAIRKSAWSIVLLGMAMGCGGETEPVPAAGGSGTIKDNYPSAANKAGKTAKPDAAPATKTDESKKGDEAPPVEGPKAENSKGGKGAVILTADELAAIKELPAAEQAAAIEQGVCPVSANHLGSMDKPVKVSAEGRTFYICCAHCDKEIKADPKAYIAKLDKK